MIFLSISGFFSEPNPDNALQYEYDVPVALQTQVLEIMGWPALIDVPAGEHEMTRKQAERVLNYVGSPFREDLIYYVGLCA